MSNIAFTVNDRPVEALAEPRTSLADFIRDTVNLPGTHLGCEHGVCGACTILIDGIPARSCITYAVACEGAALTTIEGLDDDEITTELRAAFTREHALQCGYCTPGMLISARDLVMRLPHADEKMIRVGMSGNLCRCTGYVGIVRAIFSVIEQRRSRGIPADRHGGRKTLGPAGSGHCGHKSGDRSKPSQAPLSLRENSVDTIPEFTPAHVLEQHFEVAHDADQVFAAFSDIEGIASCLPGVWLTAPTNAARIDGAINVKIGPVRAAFHGAARVEQDIAAKSGRIVGIGTDTASRSSTQGEIRYRVVSLDANRTRVDLSIGYTLKGPLSQLGRPALVHGLASRMIAEFSSNLDRRLSGRPGATNTRSADLNALSLLLAAMRAYVARMFARNNQRSG